MKAQEARCIGKSSETKRNQKRKKNGEKPLNAFDKLFLNFIYLRIKCVSKMGGEGITLLFVPNLRIIKELRDEGYGVDDSRNFHYGLVILW